MRQLSTQPPIVFNQGISFLRLDFAQVNSLRGAPAIGSPRPSVLAKLSFTE